MTLTTAKRRLKQLEKAAFLPALVAAGEAAVPWLLKNVGGAIATNFAADKIGGALGLTGQTPSPTGAPTQAPASTPNAPAAMARPRQPVHPWHNAWAKPASQLAFNAGFELFCKEAGLDREDTKAMFDLAHAVDAGHIKVSFDPSNPWAGESSQAPAKPTGMVNQFMNLLTPRVNPQADNPGMPGYDPGYVEHQDPNPYRRALGTAADWGWKGFKTLASGGANLPVEAVRTGLNLLGPAGDDQSVSPAKMLERWNATHGEQDKTFQDRGRVQDAIMGNTINQQLNKNFRGVDLSTLTPQQINAEITRVVGENANNGSNLEMHKFMDPALQHWTMEADQARKGLGPGQFGPPPAAGAPAPQTGSSPTPSAAPQPPPAAAAKPPEPAFKPPDAPTPGSVPSWANNTGGAAAPAAAPSSVAAAAPPAPKPIPEAPKVT